MGTHHQFSSIEIFLVVIVLGILGIVSSPAISEASGNSDISILVERLQQIRSHLDLYKACHDDKLPPCDSFSNFKSVMTTDISGHGSYLKKIPANPFNSLNTVRFDGAAAGAGKAGWRLDTQTGRFQADNDKGDAYL
jgi:type II secretory pathway pseudopilin PulG